MDISIFLAKILGLYLVIISIAMFANVYKFEKIIKDMVSDNAMAFLTADLALIVGILLVVSHNIWQADWRVVITVLGWLTLFKGTIRIMFPQWTEEVSERLAQSHAIVCISATITILVGIYLCYYGFR